jgi:hypothetical protein
MTQLSFYRYIRSFDEIVDEFGFIVDCVPSPKRGVTLKFDIDYDTRIVTVHYAITKNDLFNKKIGQKVCDQYPDRFFSFTYPENGFDYMGIVGYFINGVIKDTIHCASSVKQQDISTILEYANDDWR